MFTFFVIKLQVQINRSTYKSQLMILTSVLKHLFLGNPTTYHITIFSENGICNGLVICGLCLFETCGCILSIMPIRQNVSKNRGSPTKPDFYRPPFKSTLAASLRDRLQLWREHWLFLYWRRLSVWASLFSASDNSSEYKYGHEDESSLQTNYLRCESVKTCNLRFFLTHFQCLS